jgi:hypothetical protein
MALGCQNPFSELERKADAVAKMIFTTVNYGDNSQMTIRQALVDFAEEIKRSVIDL